METLPSILEPRASDALLPGLEIARERAAQQSAPSAHEFLGEQYKDLTFGLGQWVPTEDLDNDDDAAHDEFDILNIADLDLGDQYRMLSARASGKDMVPLPFMLESLDDDDDEEDEEDSPAVRVRVPRRAPRTADTAMQAPLYNSSPYFLGQQYENLMESMAGQRLQTYEETLDDDDDYELSDGKEEDRKSASARPSFLGEQYRKLASSLGLATAEDDKDGMGSEEKEAPLSALDDDDDDDDEEEGPEDPKKRGSQHADDAPVPFDLEQQSRKLAEALGQDTKAQVEAVDDEDDDEADKKQVQIWERRRRQQQRVVPIFMGDMYRTLAIALGDNLMVEELIGDSEDEAKDADETQAKAGAPEQDGDDDDDDDDEDDDDEGEAKKGKVWEKKHRESFFLGRQLKKMSQALGQVVEQHPETLDDHDDSDSDEGKEAKNAGGFDLNEQYKKVCRVLGQSVEENDEVLDDDDDDEDDVGAQAEEAKSAGPDATDKKSRESFHLGEKYKKITQTLGQNVEEHVDTLDDNDDEDDEEEDEEEEGEKEAVADPTAFNLENQLKSMEMRWGTVVDDDLDDLDDEDGDEDDDEDEDEDEEDDKRKRGDDHDGDSGGEGKKGFSLARQAEMLSTAVGKRPEEVDDDNDDDDDDDEKEEEDEVGSGKPQAKKELFLARQTERLSTAVGKRPEEVEDDDDDDDDDGDEQKEGGKASEGHGRAEPEAKTGLLAHQVHKLAAAVGKRPDEVEVDSDDDDDDGDDGEDEDARPAVAKGAEKPEAKQGFSLSRQVERLSTAVGKRPEEVEDNSNDDDDDGEEQDKDGGGKPKKSKKGHATAEPEAKTGFSLAHQLQTLSAAVGKQPEEVEDDSEDDDEQEEAEAKRGPGSRESDAKAETGGFLSQQLKSLSASVGKQPEEVEDDSDDSEADESWVKKNAGGKFGKVVRRKKAKQAAKKKREEKQEVALSKAEEKQEVASSSSKAKKALSKASYKQVKVLYENKTDKWTQMDLEAYHKLRMRRPAPDSLDNWHVKRVTQFLTMALYDDEELCSLVTLNVRKQNVTGQKLRNMTHESLTALGITSALSRVKILAKIHHMDDRPFGVHNDLRLAVSPALIGPLYFAPSLQRQNTVSDWAAVRRLLHSSSDQFCLDTFAEATTEIVSQTLRASFHSTKTCLKLENIEGAGSKQFETVEKNQKSKLETKKRNLRWQNRSCHPQDIEGSKSKKQRLDDDAHKEDEENHQSLVHLSKEVDRMSKVIEAVNGT
eukprot:g6263.t1